MDDLKWEADTSLLNQQLLKALSFEHLHTRYDNIMEAHRKTFSWTLEPPGDPEHTHMRFVEWLRHRDAIFWIR